MTAYRDTYRDVKTKYSELKRNNTPQTDFALIS